MAERKDFPEWKKPIPADPNTINTQNPGELEYWKQKLGITGRALAGAIRAVGNRSVKDVTEYLEAEAAYRKLLQHRATGQRVSPALAAKAGRLMQGLGWRASGPRRRRRKRRR